MMNDLVLMFGENAVAIAAGCGALIAAVLCALVVHDNLAQREQLRRMREEDERHRQRSKYIRDLVRQDRAQRSSEYAAIQAIESLKRP